MIRNILRRLLPGLLILFLFQTVVFFIVQIILPGDFVRRLALTLPRSESRELRETLSGDERQHDLESLIFNNTQDGKLFPILPCLTPPNIVSSFVKIW